MWQVHGLTVTRVSTCAFTHCAVWNGEISILRCAFPLLPHFPQPETKKNEDFKQTQTIVNLWRQFSLRIHARSNSPITFLVQVAAALCAVLLVPLRLVKAVGGARPHLRILRKKCKLWDVGHKKPAPIPMTELSLFVNLMSGGTVQHMP